MKGQYSGPFAGLGLRDELLGGFGGWPRDGASRHTADDIDPESPNIYHHTRIPQSFGIYR